jgi:hypothetical protein
VEDQWISGRKDTGCYVPAQSSSTAAQGDTCPSESQLCSGAGKKERQFKVKMGK